MARKETGDRTPRPQPKRTARSPQVPADTRSKGGHGAKSKAVRERAILALLSEKTITKAAEKIGIDESTLRRWLADDEAFQTAYAAARQAAFQVGMSRVQALSAQAVDTLEDLLSQKTARACVSGRRVRWSRLASISTTQNTSCTSWTRSKPPQRQGSGS